MKRIPPPLMIAAYAAMLLSLSVALAVIFFRPEIESTSGLIKIAIALLLFAIGELLNHPGQFRLEPSKKPAARSYRIFHRNRNPCPLGNLAVIVSLLLFFVGLSTFISF